MSTTPSKHRQSGIPTPGRASAIPTPGRSRSSSSANQYPPTSDVEYMSRAFADAIKANDPAHHRSIRVSDTSSLQPSPPSASLLAQSGRRSVAGRSSSVNSSSSAAAGHTPYKVLVERSKAPTGVRSSSRQSDVSVRSSSRAGRAFEVGDNVRIESLGYEGTLRYMGAIDGKSGLWAGVELSGGFAGKGKNNGTVNG
jgi:CAP-Gly domain-containing linker protein 1